MGFSSEEIAVDAEECVLDTDEKVSSWEIVSDMVLNDRNGRVRTSGDLFRKGFVWWRNCVEKVFDISGGRHNSVAVFGGDGRNFEVVRATLVACAMVQRR